MLNKILKSLGIDEKQFKEMQDQAGQIPALLKALVKQNNAQVKAIKKILETQDEIIEKQIKHYKEIEEIKKALFEHIIKK